MPNFISDHSSLVILKPMFTIVTSITISIKFLLQLKCNGHHNISMFCLLYNPWFICVGNSSQVSDGAAAVLLARRSAAKKYNLPILGVFKAFAVTGVPPDVMGIGPAYAIPDVLKQAGQSLYSLL